MDAWPIDWPASINTENYDPEAVALAEKYAVSSLRMLTLERVGGLPKTVMPTGRTCRTPQMKANMFYPAPYFPAAATLKSCNCSLYCHCSDVSAVLLTAPIGDIYEVKVDGEILDPLSYHVEDGDKLVRSDGKAWPACGGKDFTVTYLNGHKVDAMGAYAAGVLAYEFLKLITQDKTKCRLPSSVTNVQRQGLNFEIARGMFPDGVTGISEVDAFIVRWNPHGLRTRPQVYSPDIKRQREVTWRAGA